MKNDEIVIGETYVTNARINVTITGKTKKDVKSFPNTVRSVTMFTYVSSRTGQEFVISARDLLRTLAQQTAMQEASKKRREDDLAILEPLQNELDRLQLTTTVYGGAISGMRITLTSETAIRLTEMLKEVKF